MIRMRFIQSDCLVSQSPSLLSVTVTVYSTVFKTKEESNQDDDDDDNDKQKTDFRSV